eukprot:1195072-Prorocentrum_minimum.AAC.6
MSGGKRSLHCLRAELRWIQSFGGEASGASGEAAAVPPVPLSAAVPPAPPRHSVLSVPAPPPSHNRDAEPLYQPAGEGASSVTTKKPLSRFKQRRMGLLDE